MRMARVLLSEYRCDRCGHEWLPRKQQDGKQQLAPACVESARVPIGVRQERSCKRKWYNPIKR